MHIVYSYVFSVMCSVILSLRRKDTASTLQWSSDWGHNWTDKIQINKRKTNRIYSTHAVWVYMGEIL